MTAIPTAGQSVADRYLLLEEVRQTGTGAFWRARDTVHGHDVSIVQVTVPGYDHAERAAARADLVRDVEAATGFRHPAALNVEGFAEQGATMFVVSEFVAAPTLAELVDQQGPLRPAKVAQIGVDLLDVVAAADEAGIALGGVSPSSVIVPDGGPAKLVGFGLASVVEPVPQDDAEVSYRAPEYDGAGPSPTAAGVWSVGATLCFAATGQPPAPASAASSGLPDELEPAMAALLATDPASRPDATDARDLLSGLAEAESVGASPAGNGSEGSGSESNAAEEAEGIPSLPLPSLETLAEPWFFPEQVAAVRVPPDPADFPDVPPRDYSAKRRSRLGRRWQVVFVSSLVILVLVGLMITGGRLLRSSRARVRPVGPRPAAVPTNWQSYRNPDVGYTMWRPANWKIDREGKRIDFFDPRSGASLRVDHQPPPGPNTVAAMEAIEQEFARDHADYQRLQIAPTTFGGIPAAVWEYRYSDSGRIVHAADIGFAARGHGFAMTFETPDQDWHRLLPILNAFKASFRAPPGP